MNSNQFQSETLLRYAYRLLAICVVCSGLSVLSAHPQGGPGGGGPGPGGGIGGGTPPAAGTHENLQKVDLITYMTTMAATTEFCSNAVYGCPPCIVNDTKFSLGGGRVNPMGQIVTHSGGSGGGPANSQVLRTLSSGAAGGGGCLLYTSDAADE